MCLLLNMWKSDDQQVRIIFLCNQSHEYVCSEWLCQNLSTLWMKLLLPDYFIDCLRVKCDFNNDRSTENKLINITRHSLGFLSVLLIHMWHKVVKFNMQFHMWPLDAANDHMLQLEAHKVQSLLQLMLRHSVLWKPNNEIHFLKNWFHRLVFYIWASKVTKKNTKNLWFDCFCQVLNLSPSGQTDPKYTVRGSPKSFTMHPVKDRQDQTNTLLLWEHHSWKRNH